MWKSYTGIYSTRLKITSGWKLNPFFLVELLLHLFLKEMKSNNMRIIIGFM
ncbi:hypothetical protein [Clostridium beijerinckii]|uniref:hypothetical protein n=1 Tax=Clostridium beijerinckii TaxID=1520 RepID=UPI00037F81FF|nr:hypothetical protein [Clostridium beijerinckii]